MKVTDLL